MGVHFFILPEYVPVNAFDRTREGSSGSFLQNYVYRNYSTQFTAVVRTSYDVEVNDSEEEACKQVTNDCATICSLKCNLNVCLKSTPETSPTMTTAILPVERNVYYDEILF